MEEFVEEFKEERNAFVLNVFMEILVNKRPSDVLTHVKMEENMLMVPVNVLLVILALIVLLVSYLFNLSFYLSF